MTAHETWSSVLSEFAFWLWAEMDPANREYLTSQAFRGIWIVGYGCYPDKRYRRIRTCLLGEVESSSSPIWQQAPIVKYPEKVELWPDRIPDVRYPSGMSENFRPGGIGDATCRKGPSACPRKREPHDTF